MTKPSKHRSIPLALILAIILALINGLLYIFLIPPWQHYDEPNHFEYAWWIANKGGIPQATDVDTKMRRNVARSMIDHHFFDHLGFLPDLTAEGKNIWIGEYSQVNDPPLYYAIVSLPLKLFAGTGITTQLYIGRGVSLLFFLLTIVAAYGLASELSPEGHLFRLLLPLTVAILPGFVDLMTALNNDVGLVLFCSWFLWAVVRLVKHGLNLVDFAWSAGAATLAILTKQTGYLALPIIAIALLFSLSMGRTRKYVWFLIGALTLVGIAAVFDWGQPALWYNRTNQNTPVRSNAVQTPLGAYEFRLDSAENGPTNRMIQILPITISKNLAGKTITIGAWMWADRPVQIQGPSLFILDRNQQITQNVSISTEPVFYAYTIELPKKMQRGWIIIEPFDQPVPVSTSIYLDGITLVEGEFSMAGTPMFTDTFGRAGIWGGIPFENLVRNASGERAWIGLRSWFDHLASKIYPDYGLESLSLALYTVRDRTAAGWFYWNSIGQLGRTFWGRFGWGSISLAGSKPYRPLAILTVLGLGGSVLAAVQIRKKIDWEVTFLLGIAIVIVWAATIFRGSIFILGRAHFLPVARYVFPAILPTLAVLVWGWLELLQLIWRRLPSLKVWLIGGYLLLFGLIDMYALFSIHQFFNA